jgi:hypothetical protein
MGSELEEDITRVTRVAVVAEKTIKLVVFGYRG